MLEFVSTRTKVLVGIAAAAAAGAVVSGVADYKKDSASCHCECCAADAQTPVLDAATESTADIVGE